MTETNTFDDHDGRGLVVFLHGAWIHAGSWGPWIDLFDRNGYDGVALRWPGELATVDDMRSGRAVAVRVSTTTAVAQTLAAVRALDRAPILVGHDVGGYLALRVAGLIDVAAVVSAAPCRPVGSSGLPPVGGGSRTMPDEQTFLARYANRITAAEGATLHRRFVVPVYAAGPLRARAHRDVSSPPVLLLSGGEDAVAPRRLVRQLARGLRRRPSPAVCDHESLPMRGHTLVLDGGWPDVAGLCLDWLTDQNR